MNKKGFSTGVALVLLLAVLPVSAAVISLTGDVSEITFMNLAPSFSLQKDVFESNDEVFVLTEQEAILALDAPALQVDHLVDSDLADDTNALNTGFFSLTTDLTSGTVAENTMVNTYLLHFDTESDDQARVTGSVKFDEVILGVIVTETTLENTDAAYGQPFVLYPPDTVDTVDTGRGLELDGADGDWFVVSSDAQTFTFSFVSKNQFDQVRIITLDSADGPTPMTNCSGVADAEFDIIPGNRDNIIFEDSLSGVTVALFSDVDFDATTCLALAVDTLTFGRTGDEMSLVSYGFEDFDNNGFDDLIVDFNGAIAGFQVGDTEGIMKARFAQLEVPHLVNLNDFRLEFRDMVNVMEMSSQSVQTSVQAMQSGNSIFFAVHGAEAADAIKLSVFSAQGNLLTEQTSTSGKLLRWNLQNDNGFQIANGVYIYVVTSQIGDQVVSRTIGKVAVIR